MQEPDKTGSDRTKLFYLFIGTENIRNEKLRMEQPLGTAEWNK